MYYVPKDWIKRKDNESVIHEILNKYLSSDINSDVDSAVKELEDIGETTIVEKLKDGFLAIN